MTATRQYFSCTVYFYAPHVANRLQYDQLTMFWPFVFFLYSNATIRDKTKSLSLQQSSSRNSALSRSYNSVFSVGPLSPYRAFLRGGPRRLPENRSASKQIELKSTGTGESSVSIHHRRVQTRSGSTMIDKEDPIVDTHSPDRPDGSGSPGGDSGVFSSSTDKYEIIQKDIGYSSDADMSDAIEVGLVNINTLVIHKLWSTHFTDRNCMYAYSTCWSQCW